MLEACRESRHSGKLVEKLVEGIAVQVVFYNKFSLLLLFILFLSSLLFLVIMMLVMMILMDGDTNYCCCCFMLMLMLLLLWRLLVVLMMLTLVIISILEVCRENLHICTVELRLKKACKKASPGRSLFLEKKYLNIAGKFAVIDLWTSCGESFWLLPNNNLRAGRLLGLHSP